MTGGCFCGGKGCRRVAAVIQGCFNLAATGSIFAFNAYSDALKATFHLKQNQVSLAATLSNFGFNLAFPATLLLDRFGPLVVGVVGLILNVSVHLILWYLTITLDQVDLSGRALLQTAFFFLGFGASFTNMSTMITNVKNYTYGGAGKVVGLLEASQSAGPALVALFYAVFFVNGHKKDPENQNLAGYFMTMAIAYFCILVPSLFLLKNIQPDEADDINNSDSEINPILPSRDSTSSTLSTKVYTLKQLACSPIFHLMLWPFLLSVCVQFLIITNVTMYLRSFSMSQYSESAFILIPSLGAVAKMLSGMLSDKVKDRCPRMVFIFVGNVIQVIVGVLFIRHADNITIFFLMVIAIILSNSIHWCLIPVSISENYGSQSFGKVWGYVVFMYSLASFGIQALYAYDYEIHTTSKSEIYCYGLDCFTISSSVAASLSFLACCGNALFLWKSRSAESAEEYLD